MFVLQVQKCTGTCPDAINTITTKDRVYIQISLLCVGWEVHCLRGWGWQLSRQQTS